MRSRTRCYEITVGYLVIFYVSRVSLVSRDVRVVITPFEITIKSG